MSRYKREAQTILERRAQGKKAALECETFEHLLKIVNWMVKLGFESADFLVEKIKDEELRDRLFAILGATSLGFSLGAVLGLATFGPAGAFVGALVGGALGYAVGVETVRIFENRKGKFVLQTI